MEKKVSVIVPVYRTLEWLARCVQSITGQTYKNLEIILVDDGSPDDCPALCDDWAQRDDRIRVLHKENGGLVSAWMDGVSMSTGDYLCFVDSDDWIDACMVEKMLDFSSDCGKENHLRQLCTGGKKPQHRNLSGDGAGHLYGAQPAGSDSRKTSGAGKTSDHIVPLHEAFFPYFNC